MEIRNIVILYNEETTNKEVIVEDILEEGYKHNFMFANSLSVEKLDVYMMDVDEVWLFGDCSKLWQYGYYKEKGMDIWIME